MVFKDFDHNYYNNSLKYAVTRTLPPIIPVAVTTKSEVFLKDFFSKFEGIGKQQLMHSHFLEKFFKETLHFFGCWLFLKK